MGTIRESRMGNSGNAKYIEGYFLYRQNRVRTSCIFVSSLDQLSSRVVDPERQKISHRLQMWSTSAAPRTGPPLDSYYIRGRGEDWPWKFVEVTWAYGVHCARTSALSGPFTNITMSGHGAASSCILVVYLLVCMGDLMAPCP